MEARGCRSVTMGVSVLAIFLLDFAKFESISSDDGYHKLRKLRKNTIERSHKLHAFDLPKNTHKPKHF